MWWARSVCEIRSSSLHFRIVFPGCSERAISPAIFSRSGNCMGRARKRAIYKRVEEAIGVCRHRVPGAKPQTEPRLLRNSDRKAGATNAPPSHNAYTRAYFSRAILGPWGSLVYPWWFGTTRLRFKSGRTQGLSRRIGGSGSTRVVGTTVKSLFAGSRDRSKRKQPAGLASEPQGKLALSPMVPADSRCVAGLTRR